MDKIKKKTPCCW